VSKNCGSGRRILTIAPRHRQGNPEEGQIKLPTAHCHSYFRTPGESAAYCNASAWQAVLGIVAQLVMAPGEFSLPNASLSPSNGHSPGRCSPIQQSIEKMFSCSPDNHQYPVLCFHYPISPFCELIKLTPRVFLNHPTGQHTELLPAPAQALRPSPHCGSCDSGVGTEYIYVRSQFQGQYLLSIELATC
jgi:hypothetical protein